MTPSPPQEATVWSILRAACPRCRAAPIFGGIYSMNVACPGCGLRFERENGYFLGAMMVSYFLGAFSVIPTLLLLRFALEAELFTLIAIPCLQVVGMNPLLFRYSRVIWLYMDWKSDPNLK